MKKHNQTQEEFERIESYLTGSMKQEEKLAFEKSLNADEHLSQQVEDAQLLLQAVEEQSLRNKLDDFHEEITSESKQVKSPEPAEKSAFAYKIFAIAASVALLMGFGYWLMFGQKTADEKLFAQYFKPDPGLITPMSTTSDYEFYRGMVDYKQGKYNLAIERWNLLLLQKPENDTLNFYLGVSYLPEGNSKAAIAHLSIAVKHPNNAFIDESWYYLGLAQLLEGNSDEAIDSFKKSDLENSRLILKEIRQTE